MSLPEPVSCGHESELRVLRDNNADLTERLQTANERLTHKTALLSAKDKECDSLVKDIATLRQQLRDARKVAKRMK